MRHSLSSIKKLSLALGVAGIGVLAGLPALAQSTASGGTPEIELSKEGYIILCDRTPINSRCEGSPYYTGSSSQLPTENPAASPSGTTAPTENLPSESPVPSSTDGTSPDGGMMNDGSSSGSDGTMAPPSNTTAPTENLPSESPVPSAPDGGMMNDGSSSGSDGTMAPPSNTTAPTENLPSESPVPSESPSK